MLSESICPTGKKVEIVHVDLENWMPVELCEGCTASHKSHTG